MPRQPDTGWCDPTPSLTAPPEQQPGYQGFCNRRTWAGLQLVYCSQRDDGGHYPHESADFWWFDGQEANLKQVRPGLLRTGCEGEAGDYGR